MFFNGVMEPYHADCSEPLGFPKPKHDDCVDSLDLPFHMDQWQVHYERAGTVTVYSPYMIWGTRTVLEKRA